MDQHEQNALLSNLPANNFQGIPHCTTSSLMSTLQSFQIQNIGNPIIPQNDLPCDLPNQLLFEQIQLRAMQSVYNSFGQTIDSKLTPQANRNSQGTISLPFNGLPHQNNVQQPIENNQNTHNNTNASSFTLENLAVSNAPACSTSCLSTTLSVAPLVFPTAGLLNTTNGDTLAISIVPQKKSSSPIGKSINLTEPISRETAIPSFSVTHAYNGAENSTQSSFGTQFDGTRRDIPVSLQPSAALEKGREAELTTIRNENSYKMDFDEAHDDVDNIFGLSLAENDTRTNSLFRVSENRGLSPINFTPPDSPHEEMTLDMLFGIPETSKADNSEDVENNQKTIDELTDGINEDTASKTEIMEHNDVADTLLNLPKTNKIPVYKQKAVLMSIEAKTAAKKDNPNYDAFEFEEDEDLMDGAPETKPESDAPAKQETKWKSVYITKQGFLTNNHDEKELNLASVRKQAGKTVTDYNELPCDKVFFTHADALREKKNHRMTCPFLEPSQRNDTDCSKNMRTLRPDRPLLPKLIIRIQHVHQKVDDTPQKKKRTKKRKNEASTSNDEDSDWDKECLRRKKITKKIYSLHEESADRMAANSNNGNFLVLQSLDSYHNSEFREFVRKRLNMFGSAEGTLPKGTYVVCKADVLKEDCALWRVDNQNLLQKFPPFREFQTNRQVYRSSSTYSGWCEQISSQYFRVAVKVLKQNRSETTIEPEIPLHDLFPAMSAEMFKNPRTVYVKEGPIESSSESDIDEVRRVSLKTMIDACLTQCFTVNHIENLIQTKDWAFSRSVEEIERANKEADEKIRNRISVGKKHSKWIEQYTKVAVARNSFNSLTKCQICKIKKSRRIIQFYHKRNYNANNFIFEEKEEDDMNIECFRTAVDAISCGRCATAVQYLHKMKHFKLHLSLECEEKLEEIGTEEIDQTADTNIETAKSDKLWVLGLIEKHCNMWEDIDLHFRKV